jgi:hypothetical protein
MNLERLGRYKGYEMYLVSNREIEEDECAYDTMYVIRETGEIVFEGTVVGRADLEEMSVDEYPKRERYDYFKKREEVRREVEVIKSRVEEYQLTETAAPDDLFAGMDMIDAYIKEALAADLVKPFNFEPIGL